LPQESNNPLNDSPVESPAASSPFDDSAIDLGAVWKILRAEKRKIFLTGGAGLVLAGIAAFLTPNQYTASASFLTPHAASSGMSAVSSQLSAMGISGLGGSVRTADDMYIGILSSRSIAKDMVTRFNLKEVYHTKKESATEQELAMHSVFDPGAKDGIIRVSATDESPTRARDMANAYLDELHLANGRLALTEASQRRLFFEQQMTQEKDSLENAEVELKKTQEQTGLIAPIPQTNLEMQGLAETRANIEAREVELAEQDPAVVRLRGEIAGLKSQLSQMMTGGGLQAGIPTGKVPEAQLEYVRKQREVAYHETLFEILARQYEAARLDESHDAPTLQVVDYADVPDSKTGPHRSYIMLGGLLCGVALASVWVLFRKRSAFLHLA